VRIELDALTSDQTFAREFVRARLEARGIRVAGGPDADVTLQVFAAALAVDTVVETLFGLPALQAPVLAVPIPEIALFQSAIASAAAWPERDGRRGRRPGAHRGSPRAG
jgi:hypothetical protein